MLLSMSPKSIPRHAGFVKHWLNITIKYIINIAYRMMCVLLYKKKHTVLKKKHHSTTFLNVFKTYTRQALCIWSFPSLMSNKLIGVHFSNQSLVWDGVAERMKGVQNTTRKKRKKGGFGKRLSLFIIIFYPSLQVPSQDHHNFAPLAISIIYHYTTILFAPFTSRIIIQPNLRFHEQQWKKRDLRSKKIMLE